MSHRVIAPARRAGVRMTMKTLRRGFGCRYAAKVHAPVLQKLMRHSNFNTTMRYDVNVDAAVREAVLGKPAQSQPLGNNFGNKALGGRKEDRAGG